MYIYIYIIFWWIILVYPGLSWFILVYRPFLFLSNFAYIAVMYNNVHCHFGVSPILWPSHIRRVFSFFFRWRTMKSWCLLTETMSPSNSPSKSWILLEVSFEGIHKNVEQVQDWVVMPFCLHSWIQQCDMIAAPFDRWSEVVHAVDLGATCSSFSSPQGIARQLLVFAP